ncbi:MAG: exopolyphosphatase/pppGpp-phosphohydrolase [Acidimicrobiales bacterium]|jgi:exopolyphosphatase/pppGpp-phosphohydrolase
MTSVSANHAAIDIGTNSVHLVLAEVGQDDELTELIITAVSTSSVITTN